MGIIAFLLLLCSLILIAWGFGFFRSSALNQKHRSKSRPPQQPPPKVLEHKTQDTTLSKPTAPGARVQDQTILISNPQVAPRQSPAFKKSRTRLTKNKHQANIQRGDRFLQQLRSEATPVGLTMVIFTLRRMNPYAFEELLLTCCQEQGWQIQCSFRYSNDGGVDGRVLIAGKLYLIQAKRYRCHIKPQHIRDFHNVISQEGSAGGFFVHTGKTGPLSRELLRASQITLLSRQRLVDFVLGRRVKIVGITVAISSNRDSN